MKHYELPLNANADVINTVYDNGILTVNIPKIATSAPAVGGFGEKKVLLHHKKPEDVLF